MIFKSASISLTIKAGSYDVGGNRTVTFNDMPIHNALITIIKGKKLVRGEVMNKAGDVIECMGLTSTEVTITGSVSGFNGIEPTSEILNLDKIIDATIPLDVVCPFLNQKGIHQIIIMNAMLPQMEGGISEQTFTLNAISYTPTELRISGV